MLNATSKNRNTLNDFSLEFCLISTWEAEAGVQYFDSNLSACTRIWEGGVSRWKPSQPFSSNLIKLVYTVYLQLRIFSFWESTESESTDSQNQSARNGKNQMIIRIMEESHCHPSGVWESFRSSFVSGLLGTKMTTLPLSNKWINSKWDYVPCLTLVSRWAHLHLVLYHMFRVRVYEYRPPLAKTFYQRFFDPDE